MADAANFKYINPSEYYTMDYGNSMTYHPLTSVYYYNNEFRDFHDISELTYFNTIS